MIDREMMGIQKAVGSRDTQERMCYHSVGNEKSLSIIESFYSFGPSMIAFFSRPTTTIESWD